MVEYGWGNLEESYIVVILDGKWVLSDFIFMTKEIIQMVASGEKSVKLMIDLRRAGDPPPNLMLSTGWFFDNLPENTEAIITISSDSIWDSLFQITHDIYSPDTLSFHLASSVDKAYQLIEDIAI